MDLLLPILLLAAAGVFAPLVAKHRGAVFTLALIPAGVATWFAVKLAHLPTGDFISTNIEWFVRLDAGIYLWMDGFGGLMALLASGIGALIVVYAGGYLNGHRDLGRMLFLFFAFMAAMVGLVLADNIILLFVFWELTSITSYLLIGFKHEDQASREKALQALLVTGSGGLSLLAGLVLLGNAGDSWRISELVARGELITASPLYPVFTVLIMLGAFAKSAQVPLHFWLPNAMVAPTPVSAFLHSATMVKAGVFLLARLSPALEGSALWHGVLMLVGAATLLTGGVLGIVQHDLKRILAYTTIAVLGTLVLLIGIGSDLALKSMTVFLLGHALYKAALFMVAGSVDHGTGTRDVRLLAGLRRAMPFTAAAAMLAAFSKAGFPPFFGFLGKEYIYKTGTLIDSASEVFLAIAVTGNVLLFALALKAGWHPFWSKPAESAAPVNAREVPASMWLPPLLLALCGLGFGLFPGWVATTLVGPAVVGISQHPVEVTLALWHGLNVPVLLSAITVGGGILLYSRRWLFWKLHTRVESMSGAGKAYERVLAGIVDVAKTQTRAIQSGALRRYILIVVSATTLILVWKFIRFQEWPSFAASGGWHMIPMSLCIVITIGAIVAAIHKDRMVVLFALGAVGLGIALLFLHYSAPDLAITQILVEALTIILLLLVIYQLPPIQQVTRSWYNTASIAVSAAFGVSMGLLMLQAIDFQLAETISAQLAAWSYPEAYGRNVVNVILVDFRALDTFGEILVLAIAAIGVKALLTKHSPARKEETR